MFPTFGLFQNYLCPDNKTRCCRPYCHFYHEPQKREKPKVSEVQINQNNEPLVSVSLDKKNGIIYKEDITPQNQAEIGKLVLNEAVIADSGTNANLPNLNLQSPIIDPEILQKIISEAVKKVIDESSGLNLASFDPNSVIKNLDTNSIVAKAIKEVSSSSKGEKLGRNNSIEKKQPKLYLPPPNAPRYKPTPISELNRKKRPISDPLLHIGDEEYTPTSVVPCGYMSSDDIPSNKVSEESEITDFSSDNEETSKISDFDLLEEVLAEHSSNPVRSKEIMKRKKALSKKMVKGLPASLNLQRESKVNTENIPKTLSEVNISKYDSKESSSITPLSRLLPVADDSILEHSAINFETEERVSSPCDESKLDSLCKSTEDESSTLQDSSIPPSKNVRKEFDSSLLNSHRLVSQIAIPTRPNTKVWTPMAKPLIKENSCQSVEAVESMLEMLDGVCKLPTTNQELPSANQELPSANQELPSANQELPSANQNLASANKDLPSANKDLPSANKDLPSANKDLTSANKDLTSANKDLTSAKQDLTNQLEERSLTDSKKEFQNNFCDDDKKSECLTEDSDKSTLDSDKSNVITKSHNRKRSLSSSSDNSDTLDMKRKKKKKKIYKKDIKSKKRRRRDSSSDAEDYTSDSEKSEKRYSKSKNKRSKHKLHHYHKKKGSRKHKKRKDERKKSRRSSRKKRRHSYDDSNSLADSQSSDDVLIVDPSCIKKEKEDLDVYIVKIEKPEPMSLVKVDSIKSNKFSSNNSDYTPSVLNHPESSVETLSSSVKNNVEHPNFSNSSNVEMNTDGKGVEIPSSQTNTFNLGSVKKEEGANSIVTDIKCDIAVMEVLQSKSVVKSETLPNNDLNSEVQSEINNQNEKQKPKLHAELPCQIKKEPTTQYKIPFNTPQLSMFDIVVAKMEQISKPKVLTEVSLFDSVSAKDSSKHLSKAVSSSKILKSDKTKPTSSSTKASTKNEKLKHADNSLTSKLSINSSGCQSRKLDLSSSKKKDKDKKELSFISMKDEKPHNSSKHGAKDDTTLHKSHVSSSKTSKSNLKKNRDEGSSTSKHDSIKSLDSKKKSDHSLRRNSSENKKQLTIITKDKEHKSTMTTSSHNKKNGSSRKSHDSERKNKKDSKRRHSETATKSNSKDQSNLEDGCDSPIPDLSALDDLPEEDWDQLLSCNGSNARATEKQIVSFDSDDGIDYEPDFSRDDIVDSESEDANNPKVMEECKRLFSEYDSEKSCQKTSVLKKEPISPKEEPAIESAQKMRVARTGASGNLISITKPSLKPRKATPNQIMLERYMKLREEKRKLEIKLEVQSKELEQQTINSLKAPSSTTSISNSSVTSTSDCIRKKVSSQFSTVPLGGSKKRIARAPSNVQAMLQSKEEIKRRARESSSEVSTSIIQKPTLAMTSAKGSNRVAHTPTVDVLVKPIVNIDGGTKVPQNIRQRYLNCFVDEACKFCDSTSQAHKVAIAEEKICHQRASTRMVYLNLAVNVIKKLRSFQISEAALELLQKDPEFDKVDESSPQVTSSSSTTNSCVSSHPINPNHRVVSHLSVISAGGNKGSWSIKKSKKPLDAEFKDILSESKLPKFLSKYILKPDQLEENGYPRPDPNHKGKAVVKKLDTRKKISPNESMRYCDRCSVLYEVDPWGLPLLSKPCAYHWGRPYKRRAIGGGLETKYSCCQGDNQADGCCLGTTHVSANYTPDMLLGYVRTLPKDPKKDGNYGIYALDCEMCYTTAGNELTRLTVIDSNKKTVYETFVLPDNPIIDYNTRFSGITAEQMDGVKVTLRDVQATLLTIFSDKTILIGHSLESDFSALKLIHDTVIDTSLVFPHKLGPPYKRALRNLASEHLEKIIQNDVSGHDSAEDAITCMELMHWKVKEDYKLLSLQGHSKA